MARRFGLMVAAGFWSFVLAAGCGSGGDGGGGSVPDGGAGTGGGGGSQAIGLCKAICDSVPSACPEASPDTIPDCARYCDERFSHPRAGGCQAELLAFYQCLSKPNNITCFEGTYDYVDDCAALELPLYQCMKGELICNAASPAPSGGSCYAGRGSCNLMLDDCPSDQVCGTEFGGGTKCFDLSGSAASQVCASCDGFNADCKGGTICHLEPAAPTDMRCARYCCTDADCDGTPGSCWEYDTEYHIKMCYR